MELHRSGGGSAIVGPNLVGQKTAWFILAALSWQIPSVEQEDIVPCKRAVAVSQDGVLIADMHPGSMKEVIRIIHLPSKSLVNKLNPRGGMTCDMEFSPDGGLLLIANQRGAHIYDTTTWEATRLMLSDATP